MPFNFYDESARVLADLSAEDAGKIVQAIIHSAFDDTEPKFDPLLMAVYALIKGQVDRAEKIRESRSKAGRDGGAPIGNKNKQNQTKSSSVPEAVPVTVTDTNIYDDDDARAGACEQHEHEEHAETVHTPDTLFMNYFGTTPTEAEIKSVQLCLDESDHELIAHAFWNAAKNDQKNLAYVLGVLNNFNKRKIKTMADVAEDDMQREEKNRRDKYARQREPPRV
jgi:DnaD/phage-associated family protein